MTYKHEKRIPAIVWAVVADRSRARILSAAWPETPTWEVARELEHKDGALTPGEVNTDRQGSFVSAGGGYNHGEDHTDFRHHSAEHFAITLIDFLETARSKHEFGKLALVAPPLFLGVLRKKLPAPLAETVVLELDKDYTHIDVPVIARRLREEFSVQDFGPSDRI